MNPTHRESPTSMQSNQTAPGSSSNAQRSILGLWGIRYQVKDVSRSAAFYTQQLGFKLDQQNLPAFAQVSIGNLKLIRSGPGASGSRPMPDGSQQESGDGVELSSGKRSACPYFRPE